MTETIEARAGVTKENYHIILLSQEQWEKMHLEPGEKVKVRIDKVPEFEVEEVE